MKKSILLLLVVACTTLSCKKENGSKSKEYIVLLSKIINHTPGSVDNGKTICELTYNGKQLTKIIKPGRNAEETHVFHYDAKGELIGTTVSVAPNGYHPEYISSTISAANDQISQITVRYSADSTLTNTYTYQDGKISSWYSPSGDDTKYTYDKSSHLSKQVRIGTRNDKPDGRIYTDSNLTFDSQNNISDAIPYWAYFKLTVFVVDGIFPGMNNPVTEKYNFKGEMFDRSYSYEYNAYGYPVKVTIAGFNPRIYSYEYIVVK